MSQASSKSASSIANVTGAGLGDNLLPIIALLVVAIVAWLILKGGSK